MPVTYIGEGTNRVKITTPDVEQSRFYTLICQLCYAEFDIFDTHSNATMRCSSGHTRCEKCRGNMKIKPALCTVKMGFNEFYDHQSGQHFSTRREYNNFLAKNDCKFYGDPDAVKDIQKRQIENKKKRKANMKNTLGRDTERIIEQEVRQLPI